MINSTTLKNIGAKVFKRRVRIREKVYIAKRISFLLGAGVSLPESLLIVSKQCKSAQELLEKMALDISAGQSLSILLEQTLLLERIAIPIIRVGEECGTVGESFTLISEELEKRYELRQKTLTAMMYPACIFTGMIILLCVLLTVVFPKLIGVFNSLHVALPLTTRMLLFLSVVLKQWWILLLLLSIGFLVTFFILYGRSPVFRKRIEKIVLKVPIIGTMIQTTILATISRILGLLLTSNTNIISALTITEESLSYGLYKEALKNLIVAVSEGEMIADSLGVYRHLFPDEFTHMIAIGEKSGKLAETFTYLHVGYSRDLDIKTKTLSASIEPILMVILGLSIGFIAISIVGPMYQITQNLHAK